MGGFLIIEDGRGIAPASWAFDAVIEAIAVALPDDADGNALRDWLLGQRCSVLSMGNGSVDLRELTPRNQESFWQAAQRAVARASSNGPEGWFDPSFFPGWLQLFGDLMRMRELCLRGDPPEQFNPYLTTIIPSSGRHSGPGWDKNDQHSHVR